MEFGDENLPPLKELFHVSSACPETRLPTTRSVLAEVNMSTAESEKLTNQSPATGEPEQCAEGADPEAEAWSERTAVITKYDHETHCELARGFVEDLADRVVAENYKETSLECVTPEPEENLPADSSISAKKQQLSLPDLVNNAKLVSSDAVSESDEYESADEQPLHDTVYLDTNANESDASTPTESREWNASLQSSLVVQNLSQPSDIQPIVASTPSIDQAPSIAESLDCTDTIHPSVTQDTEDTENTEKTVEEELDLISHFEKLALSKQTEEAVVEQQNATFTEENSLVAETNEVTEFTESGALNQTVNLEQPLNETVVLEAETALLPDELNQTVTLPIVEPEFADATVEVVAQEEKPLDPLAAHLRTEAPVSGAEQEEEEEEESTIIKSDQEPFVHRLEEEKIEIEAEKRVVEEPIKEEEPIVARKGYDLSFLDALDNLESAVPIQGRLSSSTATTFHTPSTPEGESIVKEEVAEVAQTTEAAEKVASCVGNEPVDGPVVDSAPVTEDNTEIEPIKQIGPQIEATTLPNIEPVPESADSLDETPVSSAIQTLDDIPVSSAIKASEKMEQQEEEVVVPKKGYDLSWLDKLDDLENASPTAISAKSKVMSENSKKKEPVKKEAPEESPSSESSGSLAEEQKREEKQKKTARKPIRPRFQRPAAPAAKTDPFEIEFKFDANDDPFKPKMKLGSSPPKDEAPIAEIQPSSTMEEQVPNGEREETESKEAEIESIESRISSELDEEEFRPAEEVFRDPSALDFLMQHGGASQGTALSRQSLFVKFDPLVGGRPSMFPVRQPDGVTAVGDEAKEEARKSTGESLFLFSPPHPGSVAKTEKKEVASVAPAHPPVVDCLMSESRIVPDDVISLHEHREALQLQELLFQDKLIQKEREIQMKENESHELKVKLEGTIEAQAQMRQIVGEYEKSISQLIADKEREKANMETTLQKTIKEKDQAIEDLKEVERAFSEFHRMYERNRAAAETLQKSEEALKKTLGAYQERMQQEQQKYETLKLHAAQKLEGAQLEMENMKRALEAENARIKAQLKKTEMRLASVETSLEQKSKENEELTKLCDELINKMGASK